MIVKVQLVTHSINPHLNSRLVPIDPIGLVSPLFSAQKWPDWPQIRYNGTDYEHTIIVGAILGQKSGGVIILVFTVIASTIRILAHFRGGSPNLDGG